MRHQCNAKNVSLRPGTSQAPRCYNLYAYREVIRAGAEAFPATARSAAGEWLSRVVTWFGTLQTLQDLESSLFIRRCFSTEIPAETH